MDAPRQAALTLTLDADAAVNVTDSMNNTEPVQISGKQITVTTDPSVDLHHVSHADVAKLLAAAVGEPTMPTLEPRPGRKIGRRPGRRILGASPASTTRSWKPTIGP